MKQEKPPLSSEPERLELDKTELCALERAFAKNKEAVTKLLDADDAGLLKKSADILIRSKHLSQSRHPMVDMYYNQIAEAELQRLKRLKDGEGGFHCKHAKTEHEEALRSVMQKTAGGEMTTEN